MKKYFFLFISLLFFSCSGKRPENLGPSVQIINGVGKVTLLPCPQKPNCVSSYKDFNDKDRFLEPIEIHSTKERAYEKISKMILKDKNATPVSMIDNYIHAEYVSPLLKFVDDVEFYFGEKGFIHFRSASRIGYHDLGANKKRIEEIRFKFHQNDF